MKKNLKPLGFSESKIANKEFYIIVLKKIMDDADSFLYKGNNPMMPECLKRSFNPK